MRETKTTNPQLIESYWSSKERKQRKASTHLARRR